ncbi:hypothetical protein HK405_000461, partial [Cladochytrium tenue]
MSNAVAAPPSPPRRWRPPRSILVLDVALPAADDNHATTGAGGSSDAVVFAGDVLVGRLTFRCVPIPNPTDVDADAHAREPQAPAPARPPSAGPRRSSVVAPAAATGGSSSDPSAPSSPPAAAPPKRVSGFFAALGFGGGSGSSAAPARRVDSPVPRLSSSNDSEIGGNVHAQVDGVPPATSGTPLPPPLSLPAQGGFNDASASRGVPKLAVGAPMAPPGHSSSDQPSIIDAAVTGSTGDVGQKPPPSFFLDAGRNVSSRRTSTDAALLGGGVQPFPATSSNMGALESTGDGAMTAATEATAAQPASRLFLNTKARPTGSDSDAPPPGSAAPSSSDPTLAATSNGSAAAAPSTPLTAAFPSPILPMASLTYAPPAPPSSASGSPDPVAADEIPATGATSPATTAATPS